MVGMSGAVSAGVKRSRLAGLGSMPRGTSGVWLGSTTELGVEPGTRDMTRRSSWTILSYMEADLGSAELVVGLSE